MKEYDEDEAIAQMRNALGTDAPADDDIYQVLDLIFDYYDENGELEIDADDDDEADIDDMVDFIAGYIKGKSAVSLTHEQIRSLVLAETAYENSLL